MIETYAAYEIEAGYGSPAIVDFAIEQVVQRDLKQRGLTSDDIVSRERIEDGVPVDHDVAGRKFTVLRYLDKITIPGDQ